MAVFVFCQSQTQVTAALDCVLSVTLRLMSMLVSCLLHSTLCPCLCPVCLRVACPHQGVASAVVEMWLAGVTTPTAPNTTLTPLTHIPGTSRRWVRWVVSVRVVTALFLQVWLSLVFGKQIVLIAANTPVSPVFHTHLLAVVSFLPGISHNYKGQTSLWIITLKCQLVN